MERARRFATAVGALLLLGAALYGFRRWLDSMTGTERYAAYYINYNGRQPITSLALRLRRGEPVIFGSSELALPSRFMPYDFMRRRQGIPTSAYGHALMQSMTIYGALLSAGDREAKKNGKVVVLVSPAWFEKGDGTKPDIFAAEVASPFVVHRICENAPDDEQIRNLSGYMNEGGLTLGNALLASCRGDTSSARGGLRQWAWLAETLGGLSDRLAPVRRGGEIEVDVADASTFTPLDWEREENDARAFEARRASNPYDIYDGYFDQYIRPLIAAGKFPIRKDPLPEIEKNAEFRQFSMLVEFLDQFEQKPLIVLLPLSKKAYVGLEHFDATMNRVAAEVRAHGFGLLDLWNTPYEPAVLSDVQHTGALGWIRINRAITTHFGYR